MAPQQLSRRSMLAATAATAGGVALTKVSVADPISAGAGKRQDKTIRAAVVQRPGDPVAPNVEVVNDWPAPVAEAGQVVVRTIASALNRLDLWVGRSRKGITGSDACGIVESISEGVDEAWLGRTVIISAAVDQRPAPSPGKRPVRPPQIDLVGQRTPGTMAAKFVVPAANLLDIGESVDANEAAAFALTHITAWRMLHTKARISPEQTVLVTGIGGGVALAALNIARVVGCRIIVTSRHQRKLDAAAKLGAAHGILDKGQDWSSEVNRLTDGRGADVCVDSVGKVLYMKCLRSLAHGGTHVTCGATTGNDPQTHISMIFWKQLSILGSSMGSMDEFRAVAALFKQGVIHPVVDSVHDAANAADAYARLESGEQFGKVVVRWG